MEWILAVLLAALLAWGVVTFNRLVRLRNQVNEAWAGIDVQLQRRHELVPNLAATVKGYVQHESGALERVTRLRAQDIMPMSRREREESGLSRSIGRLFALAEDYPDLKASEGFQQLHDSLVEIEEHLQYARRYYNGSVRDNNNTVESFPSMLIARLFGFGTAAFFEIELASQRAAPAVELGGD
ncbi:LemA family protein [Elongatibacter sediminis]|uniref:LemA family protein n=1 Tax=Elongatibacter sediminis TaxID=3119006 RepID=A0AAW9RJ48_9GAMM